MTLNVVFFEGQKASHWVGKASVLSVRDLVLD